MNTPLAMAEKSVREQLQEFFEQLAAQSFEQSMSSLNRVNFYDDVLARMAAGKDITDEIPEAKGKSVKKITSVVTSLRKKAFGEANSAWELATLLASCFRTTIRTATADGEPIPQYDVEHVAETAEGQVRIAIKTWRRHLDVVITGADQALDDVHCRMTMAALKA